MLRLKQSPLKSTKILSKESKKTINRSKILVWVTCCDVTRVGQRSDADRRSPEGERRSPSEDEADEKVSSAEIHNAEDYKEIFQPKNAICRSTTASHLQSADPPMKTMTNGLVQGSGFTDLHFSLFPVWIRVHFSFCCTLNTL